MGSSCCKKAVSVTAKEDDATKNESQDDSSKKKGQISTKSNEPMGNSDSERHEPSFKIPYSDPWESSYGKLPPPPPSFRDDHAGVSPLISRGTALNKLAIDMYMKIDSISPNQNIVFSPLSIALALALVETGATGKTRNEIHKLIGPSNGDKTECGKLYGDLQKEILEFPKTDGELRIANSIFYNTDIPVKEAFLKQTKEWFETEIIASPFLDDPAKARQQINQWVSEKTAGRIPQIIGQLDRNTFCVLVNAIYLKMDWEKRFNVNETKKMSFYRFGGSEKQKVPFMCREGTIKYTSRLSLQVVELPYKGGKTSMFIVLPRSKDGIKDIEKQLNVDRLLGLLSSTYGCSDVHLKMPRFTLRQSTSLTPIFAQLGLQILNELGKMTHSPRAAISKAIHQAYVKVDEKGTEAAAVTYKHLPVDVCGFINIRPTFFIADHPFLFFVVHKSTWTIMFMGKVNSVEENE